MENTHLNMKRDGEKSIQDDVLSGQRISYSCYSCKRSNVDVLIDLGWHPVSNRFLPIIGADLNVYFCHDKAYNLAEGLMGSIKDQRFRDFWFSDKNNFFKIDSFVHCDHHCVAHERNRVILNYLNVDREHLEFV